MHIGNLGLGRSVESCGCFSVFLRRDWRDDLLALLWHIEHIVFDFRVINELTCSIRPYFCTADLYLLHKFVSIIFTPFYLVMKNFSKFMGVFDLAYKWLEYCVFLLCSLILQFSFSALTKNIRVSSRRFLILLLILREQRLLLAAFLRQFFIFLNLRKRLSEALLLHLALANIEINIIEFYRLIFIVQHTHKCTLCCLYVQLINHFLC